MSLELFSDNDQPQKTWYNEVRARLGINAWETVADATVAPSTNGIMDGERRALRDGTLTIIWVWDDTSSTWSTTISGLENLAGVPLTWTSASEELLLEDDSPHFVLKTTDADFGASLRYRDNADVDQFQLTHSPAVEALTLSSDQQDPLIRFNRDGRVGIAVAPGTGNQFQVDTDTLILKTDGRAGFGTEPGTGNQFQIGSALFILKTDGRLGLGTEPASGKDLHLKANAPRFAVQTTDADFGGRLEFLNSADTVEFTLVHNPSSGIQSLDLFSDTTNPVMKWRRDGRVGVGVNPGSGNKFQVNHSGSLVFVVEESGGIGIGEAPGAGDTLLVSGNAPDLILKTTDTDFGGSLEYQDLNGTKKFEISYTPFTDRLFFSSASESNIMQFHLDGRIGVLGSPITDATLAVNGTTGAFLLPRLTTAQRDALTPTNGMMIYNTTTDKGQIRAGGAWVNLH